MSWWSGSLAASAPGSSPTPWRRRVRAGSKSRQQRLLLVRVVGCWVLGVELGLGLPGIWIATALDWTVRSVILGAVFLRGRWRTLEL